MTGTEKNFILEFLYLEEYLALRSKQILDQMSQRGNVASINTLKTFGNCKTVNLSSAPFQP